MARTMERRQSPCRFRVAERRHGFDRRDVDTLVTRQLTALRDSRIDLLGLLLAVNVMNILDLLLTRGALEAGATEANPLMALLFSRGALPAGSFKVLCVTVVSLVVWRMREYRWVLEVGMFAFVIFAAITAVQIHAHVFLY